MQHWSDARHVRLPRLRQQSDVELMQKRETELLRRLRQQIVPRQQIVLLENFRVLGLLLVWTPQLLPPLILLRLACSSEKL